MKLQGSHIKINLLKSRCDVQTDLVLPATTSFANSDHECWYAMTSRVEWGWVLVRNLH